MANESAVAPRAGFCLAATATALALCVVMLGAFTRLVDAGLGCPDWPVCYGHLLWPMAAEEIASANAAFPDTPVDSAKTWPEQVHRIFASSLGLFCIALVATAVRQRRRGFAAPLRLPLLLLALVILQGLFGMWTVTLKLWPQVVTAHLLGGFATLALLFLLSLRLRGQRWRVEGALLPALMAIKPLLWLALLLLLGQVFLGGWTSSNYAALACPDFPMCQARWLPEMDFSGGFDFSQAIGPNYLGGVLDSAARTAIHFGHRLGAIAVTAALLLLIWRLRALPVARRQSRLLLSLLLLSS